MKNNAFVLDFNLLKEYNISAEEFLLLIHLQSNNISNLFEDQFEELQNKNFVKIDEKKEIHLREKGELLLKLTSVESVSFFKNKTKIKKSSRAIQLELDDFIKEFRNLWKGLKPGSMGSEKACKDKLYKWMQDNPSYNKEDILKAAKIYIKSLDNLNYLQQADYFIYKKDAHGESSRLSAFIDEIDNKPVEDWTSKLN